MKVKLEYIWLDGYKPTQTLRSKTKILDTDSKFPSLDELPQWSFDGSSTLQAEGNNSDCVLNPVHIIKDPQRKKGFLVMCEVLNSDKTPHVTNKRHSLNNDKDYWFGFEQEYILREKGIPLGFPKEGYPRPQGYYYCGVGSESVKGRNFVEEHLDLCLKAGLNITGVNAEVMIGQWEYQLFGKGCQQASDELWLSRFILKRLGEKYNLEVDLGAKPVKGDWNGSGLHVNFSNHLTRYLGGESIFELICNKMGENHQKDIVEYGENNHERLTGLHETQHIDKFTFGVSDRGASIRIPISTIENGWLGYLEDRRPASNADPYILTQKIYQSLYDVENELKVH